MLTIDLAGIALTWWIGAPRYPHWVVLAAMLQELGRVLVVAAWGGTVVAVNAGAWNGSVAALGSQASLMAAWGGPLLVGLLGWASCTHKITWQELGSIWKPSPQPFSVVCMRVALGNALWLVWITIWT